MRRFYDLPTLTSLAAFECVARHSSVKFATEELNVTPGAVSRQLKALESYLGVTLFSSKGKAMALTLAGEELYAALAASFSRISDVSRSIKRGDQSRNVTIVCTDTTATMWLVPRLAEFWKHHPDIMIDHLIAENNRTFRPEEMELRIRYGMGGWLNEVAEPLFQDCLYPVVSPAFAAEHSGARVKDLPALPLLDIDWVAPDWVTWQDALLRAGIASFTFTGRRIGKFALAIQAAIADQGVAIGWHRMITSHLERGELVRFTDLIFLSPGQYYLTWNAGHKLSPAALLLREWIHEAAAIERKQKLPA